MLPLMLLPQRPSLLGQAMNGSGKTGAFGLAVLNQVDVAAQHTQALVLTTSKEMSTQTADFLQRFSAALPGLQVADLATLRLRKGGALCTAHIVVSTPGSLKNAMDADTLALSRLRVLAVDEADKVVSGNEAGALTALRGVLERRPAGEPHCQALLFSASFGVLDPRDAIRFVRSASEQVRAFLGARNNATVMSPAHLPGPERVTHFFKDVSARVRELGDATPAAQNLARNELLDKVYSALSGGKAIIFATRKSVADSANTALQTVTDAGAVRKTCVIHGDIEPARRKATLDTFRAGAADVLIATTVGARGLDIKALRLVVMNEPPTIYAHPDEADYDEFQHRVGRVGRQGQSFGVVVHIVANEVERSVLDACVRKYAILGMAELPGSFAADQYEAAATAIEMELENTIPVAAS